MKHVLWVFSVQLVVYALLVLTGMFVAWLYGWTRLEGLVHMALVAISLQIAHNLVKGVRSDEL